MNDINREAMDAVSQAAKPQYEVPVVRVMSEAEVLAAFQVHANPSNTVTWWGC